MLIQMQFVVTIGRSIGSLLWFFLLVPKEWNHSVTNCHQLKMPAADGKMRLTDVADTEQLFRLIQSIPSPKAEPFEQWRRRWRRRASTRCRTRSSPSRRPGVRLLTSSDLTVLPHQDRQANHATLQG